MRRSRKVWRVSSYRNAKVSWSLVHASSDTRVLKARGHAEATFQDIGEPDFLICPMAPQRSRAVSWKAV